MRNMRQFMNGMKNYLVKHGEGKFHQEIESARSRLKADEFLNLDAILETVMHELVVLPLREHLYGMFVDYYKRSEDIQLLAQNVKYACGRSPADFGIRATVTPPSPTSLQAISVLLQRLQEAELPLEKLDLFLCVISTIFEATGCPRGQQLGADDFLPVLVYVVTKTGFVGAEIEAEFMWGLLQPTLLNGEAGYYLTALCSAVHVLKSFMASESENGTGSLDVSIAESAKLIINSHLIIYFFFPYSGAPHRCQPAPQCCASSYPTNATAHCKRAHCQCARTPLRATYAASLRTRRALLTHKTMRSSSSSMARKRF